MFRLYVYLCLWVALIWISLAKCESVCEFSNFDYQAVVEGIGEKLESSEPLHLDAVEDSVLGLNYTLLNVTLSGMKNCKVTHIQCNKKKKNELIFQYHIRCPHLVMQHKYKANGKLGNIVVEGHGIGRNDFEDYVIMFNGTYEVSVGKDKIPRPVVKKFAIDTDPKGIVKIYTNNLYHGDPVRVAQENKYMNDNLRNTEKILKSPTILRFMEVFVKNINNYSKVI